MAIPVMTPFVTASGFDLFGLFDDMTNDSFSFSTESANLVTFTFGLQTLSFTGTFTADTASVTAISLKTGASNELFSMMGAGEELFSMAGSGTELAPMPANFAAAYVSDMMLTFTGGGGNDVGWGSNNKDTILGKAGHDVLVGQRGNDTAKGGGGSDFASGGRGKDTLLGQNGHDLLRGERGDDKVKGGNGNDLIEGGTGINKVWGGSGIDTFIMDSSTTGRSVVKDYDLTDIILFTGVASSAGGNPNGLRADLAGGTLADIGKGDIDGLTIKETGAGHLRIMFETYTLVLQNTTASQVGLDQLYFADAGSAAVLAEYDDAGLTRIAGAIEGSDLRVGSHGDVVYGDEASTFMTFGAEATTFADFL